MQCGIPIARPGDGAPASAEKSEPESGERPRLLEAAGKTAPAAVGGGKNIWRNIAGFLLVALILFAVVGAIVRIFSLSASAIHGDFGPEHILLVFVAVLALYWLFNRTKRK